jgi:lipoprotein-anchoring transpeptidase ErfK/SrfK
VTTVAPKVTMDALRKKYPAYIIVDRGAFTLRFYKHLQFHKAYPIAVGMQGLETPAGTYPVVDKQINPVWHVPNSDWAGKLAGRVIPPGPDNPIKARWIGITGGAGIHGTEDVGSLGTNASHGCIRMAIPDVIDLFDRVPYGSTIFIH